MSGSRLFACAVVAAWVVLVTSCTGSRALAQDVSARQGACGRAGRPWVSLVFAGGDWPDSLREAVTADLRAGLRLRGIDVCALGAQGSEPPLALVQLGSPSTERVAVTIDVHDAVTEKRVLRDVDLRRVVPDGRGLRVAQATEELLRASWAELALTDAPELVSSPPAEVTRAIAFPRERSRSHALGVRFVLVHHGEGMTFFGGAASLAWFFAERMGIELVLGGLRGLREDATHGSVDSSALLVSLGLQVALVPRSGRIDLFAKLGTTFSRLQLAGRADAPADANENALLAATGQVSLAGQLWLSHAFALALEAGPGLPLRSAQAVDTGKTVAGTGGLELHAALGVEVAF